MIGNVLVSAFLYIVMGYAVLVALDLADSGLTRHMPTRGHGSVTWPVFIMMAWPFAILLYILTIPVLIVKALSYTLKGHKEWL